MTLTRTRSPAQRPGTDSDTNPTDAVFDLAHASRVRSFKEHLPDVDQRDGALTILDITKWFGETSGGVKTYLLEKAHYVASHPSLRHVLVIPGPFDAISPGKGVRVYRLRGPRIPTQSAYRFLFATRSTRRILTHERPDVIEVGSPFVVPWVTAIAARGQRVPMVAFHHMSLARSGGGTGSRSANPITQAYLRTLGRLFAVTIAASDYAAAELMEAGVPRVVRVPLGVDVAHFRPRCPGNRDEVRRRFGIPLDLPMVLYVGRLAPEKSLDVLLDAWHAARLDRAATLVIAGTGTHAAFLQGHTRARNVHWLPYQANRGVLARLYAAADVYASPCPQETFGLSALEALASGIPVLSADRGGVAELVRASHGGALFESGSVEACATALRTMLQNSLSTLGNSGRAYAAREHAWTTVFDRLVGVYRDVIAR